MRAERRATLVTQSRMLPPSIELLRDDGRCDFFVATRDNGPRRAGVAPHFFQQGSRREGRRINRACSIFFLQKKYGGSYEE
ncbi:hypothetical protein CP532_4748 [Ophiocordyceps camponoti-leonardi (nom. inval.)]|nr:hypothetical protein CP532_4748 [Ophiocordyceps camponoti-leonardi (nom. inval.)]